MNELQVFLILRCFIVDARENIVAYLFILGHLSSNAEDRVCGRMFSFWNKYN